MVTVRAVAGARSRPREAAHGEYYAMLLTSVGGMGVLVQAQNIVTLFLGLELLSIPLYVLCATEMRRASSLESGLKYLIVGSVGSATLLYGLALHLRRDRPRPTSPRSATRCRRATASVSDPLFLTGMALVLVGLAFKASVAPFHQWTPDVYEGAPTPITAFMATATKAAAFGVLIRFFDVALIDAQPDWAPLLAALATITIVVGNVGAIGQTLGQAAAGLVGRRAGRLHARRRASSPRSWASRPSSSTWRLPGDERRRVRGDRRPRARDRPGRLDPGAGGPRRDATRCWPGR